MEVVGDTARIATEVDWVMDGTVIAPATIMDIGTVIMMALLMVTAITIHTTKIVESIMATEEGVLEQAALGCVQVHLPIDTIVLLLLDWLVMLTVAMYCSQMTQSQFKVAPA